MMIVATLLCVCAVATGCPQKRESYDVSIKVACFEVDEQGFVKREILEEWIFTPDIDEITTEMEYDGKRYCYKVIEYNMPLHPEYGDRWPTENNLFYADLWRQDDKKVLKEVDFVCEKGDYLFDVATKHPSEWQANYRHVLLNIKIK